ncbi:hypothetical protein ACH9DO_16480 [Kocuria sp. M1N1S27]|uniref:hypothetical protein n=1 Tax=Kocuria kalidii TaxID=3376283 RepID=UPI0037A8A529
MMRRSTTPTPSAAAVAVLAAAAGLALTGCGTENVEGAMPYDEFYEQRADYVGQEVTLSAEVEDVISDDGLTIDSATSDSMMVLYDMDRVDVEEGQLVEVTGTVQDAFDPTTLDDQAEEDFTDEFYQDYEAQPYIEATDVTLVAQD